MSDRSSHALGSITGDALRARVERLRALNSAWAVMAPFGLAFSAQHVVAAGRGVSEELERLAGQTPDQRDSNVLPKLDSHLDAIESELRTLAFEVPVAQLRSALQRHPARERRGVLDLLDLLLVPELAGEEGTAGRISAIDCLITILCTGGDDGDGKVRDDPIGLTPRLHELCTRQTEDSNPRLAAIAAEFVAATEMTTHAALEEVRLRTLRKHKRQLGRSFFAPSVLRAIVQYNASMSRSIDRGLHDSRDWGSLASSAGQESANTSVFESQVLPRLAEALARRARGLAPTSSAVDRIAWCLDTGSLDAGALSALADAEVGRPQNLVGTAMLVGLLCRAAVVLEAELPGIGIDPERLSKQWVQELDAAFKRKVKENISGNSYREAVALSELRSSFLHSLLGEEQRASRQRSGEALAADRQAGASQAATAREQGTRDRGPATRKPASAASREEREGKPGRAWPIAQLARLAAIAVGVGLLAMFIVTLVFRGDLTRMRGDELARISPYLESGGRTDSGRGTAFVGTLEVGEWAALTSAEQQMAAGQMVEALRARGVRDVMVYDGQERLRVQALGTGGPQLIP